MSSTFLNALRSFKYLAVLRMGWLEALVYRTEFFMSVLSWGIRLVISIFLWLAIVESKGGLIGDYTFQTILIYFFLIQITASLNFTSIGFDICKDIHRGDIANYLLKPMQYIIFRLIHSLSYQFFRMIVAIIIFGGLIIYVVGDFHFPLWKIPVFIAAMLGAYVINASFQIIIGLSSFWVVNAHRFLFTYFGILTMASGILVPLDLFPKDIFVWVSKLPFAYIFFYPVKMMQASAFDPIFYSQMSIQWFYAALLLVIVSLLYKFGLRKLESVGR